MVNNSLDSSVPDNSHIHTQGRIKSNPVLELSVPVSCQKNTVHTGFGPVRVSIRATAPSRRCGVLSTAHFPCPIGRRRRNVCWYISLPGKSIPPQPYIARVFGATLLTDTRARTVSDRKHLRAPAVLRALLRLQVPSTVRS
uniref:Uncharacterized protein n=1 Tax=Anopheles culicifacies TaxID=139723 RepID=A0A182LXA8_9DIPT